MTVPQFDPEQDLPPDGATWTGITLPDLGVRTWTFTFPWWQSTDAYGRQPLLARAFDPAGQVITRKWVEETTA